MPEVLVADFWFGTSRGPCVLQVVGGEVVSLTPAVGAGGRFTVMPGIVDHHVHLGLVQHGQLAGGPVVEVHDLGWTPREALALRAEPPAGVRVRVAGPFHTAPGGYPKGRSWAPEESICEISSPAEAVAATADAGTFSYDFFKIVLHAGMGDFSSSVVECLVDGAQAERLPVAAHVEGAGQAERAIHLGADVLVHAPWTESLSDEVLVRGLAGEWISTLAIHDAAGRATAIDNIRRFRRLGGRVRYGTDMGNGPTPVGVNSEEVHLLGEVGLAGDELLGALVGEVALPVPAERLLFSPHPLPTSASEVLVWLADARRLTDLIPQGDQP